MCLSICMLMFELCIPEAGICTPQQRASRRHNTRRMRKRRERARIVNEPDRLPIKRRALSIPSHRKRSFLKKSSWPWSSTPPSSQNTLATLPPEVRIKIFTEVVGRNIIHLVPLPKRLGHFQCQCVPTGVSTGVFGYDMDRYCVPYSDRRWQNYLTPEWLGDGYRPQCDDAGLALLRTCRQFYREGCALLYSSNVFDFEHPRTLTYLERTIRADRLASIRSLQISWNDAYCPQGWTPGCHEVEEPREKMHPTDFHHWLWACGIIAEKMMGLESLKIKVVLARSYRDGKPHGMTWKEYSAPFLRTLEVMQRIQNLALHFTPWDRFDEDD